MKDFYWDIRPKPEYGTIELRVCDTPLSVEHAAALAGYLQALCAHLLEHGEPPQEKDYLVYTYNRFLACRFGLDGELVHPRTYEKRALRDDILATTQMIRPQAKALGAQEAVDRIEDTARSHGDAALLRALAQAGGNAESMVDGALSRFRSTPS